MRLESIDLEAVREPRGFTFLMRTPDTMQTVRVFVADEALEGARVISSQDKLRAQFEAERAALEEVARAKYSHGQVAANGMIAITLADVVGFMH